MADDPNKPKSKDDEKNKDKENENEENSQNEENQTNEREGDSQETPTTSATPAARETSATPTTPVIPVPPVPQPTPLQATAEQPRSGQPPSLPATPSSVPILRQDELTEATRTLKRQISQTPPPPISMPPPTRAYIENQPNQRNQPPQFGFNNSLARQQPNGDYPNQAQQQQIPVIIVMRRDQPRSDVNPFLMPLRRPTNPNYTPLRVGREPSRVMCPVCREYVLTMVVLEPKHPQCLLTFLLCTIPCCCCCWPCVCLPYCMDSCQNANHYCPNCNSYVGTFEN